MKKRDDLTTSDYRIGCGWRNGQDQSLWHVEVVLIADRPVIEAHCSPL